MYFELVKKLVKSADGTKTYVNFYLMTEDGKLFGISPKKYGEHDNYAVLNALSTLIK